MAEKPKAKTAPRELIDQVMQEGIELEVIQIVLSIYLRDIALKELNFDLKDIESHEKKQTAEDTKE